MTRSLRLAKWLRIRPQLPRTAMDHRYGLPIVIWRQSMTISAGGFDAPVHISEEASNARTAVPWAIISGVGAAGVLGWGESW